MIRLFKTVLAALSLLALVASPSQAQELAGTWQGTLEAPNRSLRTVFKITQAADGTLPAVMYSIDQGGQPIATSGVAIQGGTVKINIPALGGGYEGRVSADGNAMTGTFTQGGGKLPLNLTRTTPETAWAIPAPPAALKPMAADAKPSFDVATIKPSQPGAPGRAFLVRGRQFSTLNTTLVDLIRFAYGVHGKQIVNAPEWATVDKYDITARPEGEGQPNDAQWKGMVQKMLADRFKLAFHRDQRELSVYALVPARTGAKLTPSAGEPNGLPSLMFRGLGTLPAMNASMAQFAGVLGDPVLDRPVVDQTGLTGKYDFTLTWTPDEAQFGGMGVRVPPPTDNPSAPPNLFTAIQEQLGLRLESTRAPAEALVIDTLEKPTPD